MDVAAWLQDLGLERYVPAFRDNDIDAEVLRKLTAEDLISIGVTSVGHRRKLLDAITSLGMAVPAAVVTAPAPGPPAQVEAERRQLTVMFCDLVGSTALSTRHDPEDLRELIADYHRAVSKTVRRFDGFVAKYMGDGVLIYFGYPQAHEDDAERAVRAGLAVIEAVGQLPAREDLSVRLGIATGLAVVGDLIGEGAAQERGVIGETPNLAARLQALSTPNTLVIGEATRRQIGGLFDLEDLAPQHLAGFVEPQPAWRVLGESDEVSRFEALRSGETPLVGREEEVELLVRRWQQELLKEAVAVFESLGDVRSRAIAMGRIADILQARGQLDEAFKIRSEEELPVYEQLGNLRERAMTMRGHLDEALRIREGDVLPAFERLRDPRLVAVEKGKIADILQARGQLDEALKIRNEEELPVYERLGDVRSRAVTMGKIAEIFASRGQLDEALDMHSERLAVAEAMGDIDSVAHIRFRCALIRLDRGGLEKGEGEIIVHELAESFSIMQRTGRVDAIANVGRRFGQVLASLGRRKESTTVFDAAARAFETLHRTEDARQVRSFQDLLRAVPEQTGESEELTRPPSIERLLDPSTVPPPSARGVLNVAEGPTVTPSLPLHADKAEYLVWYGTNRRPNDFSNSNKGYSAARDNVVHYGSCRVFIPQSHKIGSIGSPWWKRLITLTDDRLRLLSVNEFERSAYWTGIAAQLAAIDADERCALVFVHGYNVSFQDAALRAAQIGFDLSVKGAMAFFSWPSQGSTRGYPADEATIEASEGVIADFMTDFAGRSGAAAVHIIAHSMGNRGVLRAVNRIAAKAQRRTGKPFGQVILAAADIDADVFRQLSAAYAQVASRTTLYVSKRDLAVEASRWLHNFPRAGLMPPTLVLPGIDTINVTNVDLTMLGHGYVAEARDVLTDMHALITRGAPPDQRFGLREAKNEEGARYWLVGA